MKITLPHLSSPMVGRDGAPISPWIQFFAKLVAAPDPITSVVVTASPFSTKASETGSFSVVGGTVSAIAIIRGQVTLATGLTSGLFPVGSGDILQITYTVVPTVNFIPG